MISDTMASKDTGFDIFKSLLLRLHQRLLIFCVDDISLSNEEKDEAGNGRYQYAMVRKFVKNMNSRAN